LSIAGLPGSSARVLVGPPLSARLSSSGLVFTWSPCAVSVPPGGGSNPQVSPLSMLSPADWIAGMRPPQLASNPPLTLEARIVLFTVTGPPAKIPAPGVVFIGVGRIPIPGPMRMLNRPVAVSSSAIVSFVSETGPPCV
jgi:hypothetical protein